MSRIFFSKLRLHIKDNDNSPHGKFHRFLFPFSSKFPDLNFGRYVLYVYSCVTQTVSLGYLCLKQKVAMYEKRVCTDRNGALLLFLLLLNRRAGLSVGISDKT